MKRLLLLFITAFSTICTYAQTNLIVGAPANNGSTTGIRAPNGTTGHTTLRGHLLITAAELSSIPTGTVITGVGFLLNAGASSVASGNMQIYLQNTTDVTNQKSTTWATAITGMTSVYNGTYTIPDSAGPIDMNTSSFTYTGGGLYVAYDYLGSTFATSGAIYLCNTSLASGVKMQYSSTTTAPTTLSQSSSFRPEIRLKIPNPYTNNIKMLGAYASHGSPNRLLGSTQSVKVRVKNISSGQLTNIPITVNVTGANTGTATQTLASLAPGVESEVTVSGLSIANSGSQSVRVTIPVDQDPIGDTVIFGQIVSCEDIGEGYTDTATTGLGFGSGEGILANMMAFGTTPSVYIKKVKPTLNGSTTVGHTIKGVILNSAGVIIDSSADYTVTAADIGNQVELTLLDGSTDYAGDTVYYGFRQISSGTAYYPLGTTDATGVVPDGVFCSFDAYGVTGYNFYTQYGAFLIEAEVLPKTSLSLTTSPTSVCAGTPVALIATPGYSNYQYIINNTSVQNGSSATYNYTPTSTFDAVVLGTSGTCVFVGDTQTVQVGQPSQDSITATICQNQTYQFGSSTLSSAGFYQNVFTSLSNGCDSTVDLELIVLPVLTNAISESICQGETYNFNGTSLSTAGTYMDTLSSAGGCDSIVTLTLSVNNSSLTTLADSFCAGTTYDFNGTILSSGGTYYDTLLNAGGCDSVIFLNLAQTITNTGVTANSDSTSLTADQAGATYLWIDCSTGLATSLTTQTIEALITPAGDYRVVVTYNGCSDTSACYTLLDPEAIHSPELSNNIKIYPNPAHDHLTITSQAELITSYIITDAMGRTVQTQQAAFPTAKWEIDATALSPGAYIMQVICGEKSATKSLLIK